MPIDVGGITYLFASELAAELGVSRTTFWRWRREGKVPSGRRFRDRQVLFTEEESQRVRDYATRIEPINTADSRQLKLF